MTPPSHRNHVFQENNQSDIDEISFDDENNEVEDDIDHLDLVVGFLLKLREKYNVSTAANCLISEKLGLFIDQDRKMHAKELQNISQKD